MAEPGVLPLRSPLTFAAGKREVVLGTWDQELEKHKVNIVYRAKVGSVQGQQGAFEIKTASGAVYHAENAVLCIGLQGNLNTLRVPGDDLPKASTSSTTPRVQRETIVVVVGGRCSRERVASPKQRVSSQRTDDSHARSR